MAPVTLPDAVPEAWFWSAVTFLATFAVVFGVGRLLLVPPVVRIVRARNPDNPTLPQATRRYLTLVVVVAAFWFATVAAGFGGVFAGSALVLAAATLALGVAGQDVIGNLVSGVFLVADRDFNVGDWIEWNDRTGWVEAIEYRVTRVRTAAGEVVTVPNTELAANAVTSPYARDRYRLTETVGVPIGSDVARSARLLRAAASADERVLTDPGPEVHATGFGSTSVDLEVRFWVRDPKGTDLADVRTGFVERANERFADADVTLNPPSQHELSGSVGVRDADPKSGA